MDFQKEITKLPNWIWVRGMMSTDGRMFVQYADDGEAAWLWVADDGCEWEPVEGKFPDLSDAATAHLVVSLIERHTDQCVWVEKWPAGHVVYTIERNENNLFRKTLCVAETREEALFGALENVL